MTGITLTSKCLIFIVVFRKLEIIRKAKKELVKTLKIVKQLLNKNSKN